MKAKIVLASMALLATLLAGGCTIPLAPASTTPGVQPVSTLAGATLPDFIAVVGKARPSVVAITTEIPVNFFGRRFTQEGAGSGWIIDAGGLIVTNNHVIEGANTVTVTLEDGRTFPAVAISTSASADLAVIKINTGNLPALQIGDSSQLQVGEWVLAIGNALGLGTSATKGIVSALGVSLDGSGDNLSDLIQTDAAINPGNSGGPLLNMAGQVVGINSAKISQVGVEGMGYAISVNEAKPIIDQLIKRLP